MPLTGFAVAKALPPAAAPVAQPVARNAPPTPAIRRKSRRGMAESAPESAIPVNPEAPGSGGNSSKGGGTSAGSKGSTILRKGQGQGFRENALPSDRRQIRIACVASLNFSVRHRQSVLS